MKKIRKVLSLLLAMALLFGMATVTSMVSASAETTEVGTFFSFSPDRVTESQGVKAIAATEDGGMLFESTENDFSFKSTYTIPEDQRSYITAVFDADEEEVSQGLEELRAEPNYRKLSLDLELLSSEGFAENAIKNYVQFGKKDDASLPEMGWGADIRFYIIGQDADGNELQTVAMRFLSPQENPKKNITFSLNPNMVSVDRVQVEVSWRGDTVEGITNVKFNASSIYIVENDTQYAQPSEPCEDCVIDWSYVPATLGGSGRLAFSGAVDMDITEDQLYPVSAATFSGQGNAGWNSTDWRWEDVSVNATNLAPGLFSDYDGIQFYVKSGEDDFTSRIGGITFYCWVPNRDESGNYLDAAGNIVDESQAAYYKVLFQLTDRDLPTVMKGETNVVSVDFSLFEFSLPYVTQYLPETFGYYYDNLTLADCKDMIVEFGVNKGEMTINEKTIDFSVGDIYGATLNEDGELESDMPIAGNYTPPPEELPDTEAAARINELYQILPKDMDSYIGNNALMMQLQEFVDLWTATSQKTKTYIEQTYGITEDDYVTLYYIYDDLIAFGYLDPSTGGSTSNPSNGVKEMGWEFYMTLALSGVALLTVICAGAVVAVYRRKREQE